MSDFLSKQVDQHTDELPKGSKLIVVIIVIIIALWFTTRS